MIQAIYCELSKFKGELSFLKKISFLQLQKLKELIQLKLKFAFTSLIATGLDYVLYLILVSYFFAPILSNIIAYTMAVIVNFSLQKRFVFSMKRKFSTVFLLAIGVSFIGLILSTSIIAGLIKHSFFMQYQFITKLVATGIVFFWNFYMKRFVFERKFV